MLSAKGQVMTRTNHTRSPGARNHKIWLAHTFFFSASWLSAIYKQLHPIRACFPHSAMSQVGSLSSFTYAGIAGLSMVSLVGLVKLLRRFFQAYDDISRRDAEISELRRALKAAQLDAQAKNEALAALRKELEAMKCQVQEEQRVLDTAQRHNLALGEQLSGQTRENQVHKDELARLGEKHAQTLALLDVRTMELKGAEAFLTKADALSGADVILMVNALNAEIYQTAAIVAESFEFKAEEGGDEETRTQEEVAAMEEVYVSAGEIVGAPMLDLLRSSKHHEDPTLVQIAFQAGMTAYSNWIFTSWDFEDPEDNNGLSRIYDRIRHAEEQAVSGRWRALTRAHIPRMANHELAMYFMDAFVNILLAADVAQQRSELQEAIESRFAERVGVIVKGAQTLRKAIGEEITSSDFEIVYVAHDSPFNPSAMDDAFASDFEKGRDKPEPVLCTTELGLTRVVKVPGRVGEWDETVLLRPKIALKSGIDEMMGTE
ncbi:hypothetical protein D9615_008989 [Tricholomella constricta]|uniref:Uncharacterized protein n=1 Tax=Tricholomella constricta TaxID=117010 RepID=A0A8H5LYY0_9AGAR|nr:hypothetical protein D9615_008989 [Tricholomella constricta]